MFESTFVGHGASRKSWPVVVSFLAQSLLVCVAVVIPLLTTRSLPAQQWFSVLLEPPRPPAPAAPPVAEPQPRQAAPARMDDSVFRAPAVIPEKVALITDTEQPIAPAQDTGPRVVGVSQVVIRTRYFRDRARPSSRRLGRLSLNPNSRPRRSASPSAARYRRRCWCGSLARSTHRSLGRRASAAPCACRRSSELMARFESCVCSADIRCWCERARRRAAMALPADRTQQPARRGADAD